MDMFIKDGELPENLLKKKNKTDTEETAESDKAAEDTASDQIVEKPLSEYTNEDWYAKYPKPDIMDRFKVHVIDTLSFFIPGALIYYFLIPNTEFELTGFLFVLFFAIYLNAAIFLTWIELYFTNGYTLGKYIFKHRVFRMDGERLTFRDVFVRNFLIKAFCDWASFGMLNIISIIIAYLRPYTRAVHDVAANTITVDVRIVEPKPEKRYEFK